MELRRLNPRWRRLCNLFLFRTPRLWSRWPFLPVVRLSPGCVDVECGLLYDARGVSGTYGYSATVFLCNYYRLPHGEAAVLALPKRVYDTAEEIADAGWTVD
jgi:hypothetical protein